MNESLSYAGVVLIPLIIGLIQFIKKIFPEADSRIWLLLSMFLGILGQVAVYVADTGTPSDFKQWLTLIILGLAFGLATSKTYDETLRGGQILKFFGLINE